MLTEKTKAKIKKDIHKNDRVTIKQCKIAMDQSLKREIRTRKSLFKANKIHKISIHKHMVYLLMSDPNKFSKEIYNKEK